MIEIYAFNLIRSNLILEMNEDDILKDENLPEDEPEDLDVGLEEKKKKDMIDEETESLDDLEEEELGEDEIEPFDDEDH